MTSFHVETAVLITRVKESDIKFKIRSD